MLIIENQSKAWMTARERIDGAVVFVACKWKHIENVDHTDDNHTDDDNDTDDNTLMLMMAMQSGNNLISLHHNI